jgi:hypothetical protein
MLDPRLAGTPGAAIVEPPTADAGEALSVKHGKSFILDAGASRAASGRSIEEYRWRRLPPEDL